MNLIESDSVEFTQRPQVGSVGVVVDGSQSKQVL